MSPTTKTLFFALTFSISSLSLAAGITGAGSSAAKPLYERWAAHYTQAKDVTFSYQAVGSSAGIRQIKDRLVAFGASDVAMSREEMTKENLFCFPTAISGVVPIINLPGIKTGEIALTGAVMAAIYSGKITRWNDAEIAALNPAIRLPKLPIVPVARQDGSGTTYNFTDYLSKVSPAWKADFGTHYTIKWPSTAVQVQGSSGIVAEVKRIAGAIGYVDYNYVVQDKLVYPKLQNRDGNYVLPSPVTFSAALANSSWKTHGAYEEMLTDKAGTISWPITMGTFVIVPRRAQQTEASIATLKFFTWAFMNGDGLANGMDFVRLPDAVQARIYRELTGISDSSGKPLQWSIM